MNASFPPPAQPFQQPTPCRCSKCGWEAPVDPATYLQILIVNENIYCLRCMVMFYQRTFGLMQPMRPPMASLSQIDLDLPAARKRRPAKRPRRK